MPTMGIHRMKKDDLRPSLLATLYDENGNPLNLSPGGTTVTFVMKNRKTGVVKVNRAATVTGGGTGGTVQFDWATGDTDTVGEYDGEFRVLLSGTTPITCPSDGEFPIVIRSRLN
jgi:hypothetical protein